MAIINLDEAVRELQVNEVYSAYSSVVINGSRGNNDVVRVNAGAAVTTNSSVERVEFANNSEAYTFKKTNTGVQVLDGDKVVANVKAGTNLVFADGLARVGGTFDDVTGVYTYTLGGAAVSDTAGKVVPALSTAVGDFSAIKAGASALTVLTTGQDSLVGTGADNTFTAKVINNGNTLQSGDVIDGGAGNDTLNATVGSSSGFAILAETNSVEKVVIQAQAQAGDSADNFIKNAPFAASPLGDAGFRFSYDNASNDTATQIDAQLMKGVKELWSDNSRANLVIEDVSVNSNITTIGMRDTDPGNVNYEVYFDPQNITNAGGGNKDASITLLIEDTLDLAKGGNGLTTMKLNKISITIGGTVVDIPVVDADTVTYSALADKIQAGLLAKGYTGITVSRVADTPVFSIEITDNNITYLKGQSAGKSYDKIILTNSGPEALTDVKYSQDASVKNSANTALTFKAGDAVTYDSLTQVNVVLDNVARGDVSGSGDLVIGDMSESGIQQFNVQVVNSSHIDQMASTNNVLEVVNVVNAPTTDRNLGTVAKNGNLRINKLDDVRVFDASKMTGNVDLTAKLSADITSKYLNLKDSNINPSTGNIDPALDNSELDYLNVASKQFYYASGAGADKLNLSVSSANFSNNGTVNREDFVLKIEGGAGNDELTFAIRDYSVAGAGALAAGGNVNWYLNQRINDNNASTITINGGAGDDTIRTPGSGDLIINGDAGNDVIYTDNTGALTNAGLLATAAAAGIAAGIAGSAAYTAAYDAVIAATTGNGIFNNGKAAWVINAFNTNIDDLQSNPAASVSAVNATLTVNFLDLASKAVYIAGSEGAMQNKAITDLTVNQAIKEAINNDAILKNLLVAEDGPGRTLVIKSLIDGVQTGVDLTITFGNSALNAAQIANAVTLYAPPAAFNPVNAFDLDVSAAANNLVGDVSTTSTHDNVITPGADNDLIVLSTTTTGVSELLSSNEIIKYAASFGNDTIVNFEIDTLVTFGDDTLDFTAIGGDINAVSTNFNNTADNSILVALTATVQAATVSTDILVDVAAYASSAANALATTHVVVVVDAHNIGSVYTVSDAALAGANTATLAGTIDLADVNWMTLTAADFI